ncbi:MAG: hypothetical protein ACM3O4_05315 [Ignavibacteriales bacterium]
MKGIYNINNLITGNVLSVSSNNLMCNESKETFIFERQTKRLFGPKIYKEIFTELALKLDSDNYSDNSYSANFDQSYIVNEQDFTCSNLLTYKEEETGLITKVRLLEIYNTLNFNREMIIPRVATPKQKVRKRG